MENTINPKKITWYFLLHICFSSSTQIQENTLNHEKNASTIPLLTPKIHTSLATVMTMWSTSSFLVTSFCLAWISLLLRRFSLLIITSMSSSSSPSSSEEEEDIWGDGGDTGGFLLVTEGLEGTDDVLAELMTKSTGCLIGACGSNLWYFLVLRSD